MRKKTLFLFQVFADFFPAYLPIEIELIVVELLLMVTNRNKNYIPNKLVSFLSYKSFKSFREGYCSVFSSLKRRMNVVAVAVPQFDIPLTKSNTYNSHRMAVSQRGALQYC